MKKTILTIVMALSILAVGSDKEPIHITDGSVETAGQMTTQGSDPSGGGI